MKYSGQQCMQWIAPLGEMEKRSLLPHRSICWRTGKADGEPLVCSVCLCATETHEQFKG